MSSHLSLFPFCLYNENGNGVYFFKHFLFPQLPPLKTANRFEDRKRGVLFILFYPLQVNWKKLAFTPLLGGRGGGGEEGYLCRRRSEAALPRRWRGASLLHRTEGAQSGPVWDPSGLPSWSQTPRAARSEDGVAGEPGQAWERGRRVGDIAPAALGRWRAESAGLRLSPVWFGGGISASAFPSAVNLAEKRILPSKGWFTGHSWRSGSPSQCAGKRMLPGAGSGDASPKILDILRQELGWEAGAGGGDRGWCIGSVLVLKPGVGLQNFRLRLSRRAGALCDAPASFCILWVFALGNHKGLDKSGLKPWVSARDRHFVYSGPVYMTKWRKGRIFIYIGIW